MTKLTYNKEENSQAHLFSPVGDVSSAAGQILHLKRLLVTLKQQYEKGMQDLQERLQTEQAQKQALKQEVDLIHSKEDELKQQHEEELKALREQQVVLHDLLKKAQEELKQQREFVSAPAQQDPDFVASCQRMEQLERVIPYLRERTEEAHLETEQLREELEKAQRKVKEFEADFLREKLQAQEEIENLKQSLALQEEKNPEVIASHTSSYQLRQELEMIKRTFLQDSQETKALELRYIEVLREKVDFEHQLKQLQIQLEHQSTNLSAFQQNIHELDLLKKTLETSLQEKEKLLTQSENQQLDLEEQVHHLESALQERLFVQESYEQLKEEWSELSHQLEEALEIRIHAEQQFEQLEEVVKDQDRCLAEKGEQIFQLLQEKEGLEATIQEVNIQLEESETRLKIAQQHLAKKVKEAALLTEKLEERQISLEEALEALESFKIQSNQLQASAEFYQKQEKQLQEQLHTALKGNEAQVAKWEEKYFSMYDKWQESENHIRELKKIEQKHHHMQSLLANLGTFMGPSFSTSSTSLLHYMQEAAEKATSNKSPLFEMDQEKEQTIRDSKFEVTEEKYDLFGMKQAQDNSKANIFL